MSVTLADASDALNSYVVTRLVKSFLVVGTHTNCISSHGAGTNTSSLHSRPTVDAASVNEAVADIIRLRSRSGVAPVSSLSFWDQYYNIAPTSAPPNVTKMGLFSTRPGVIRWKTVALEFEVQ